MLHFVVLVFRLATIYNQGLAIDTTGLPGSVNEEVLLRPQYPIFFDPGFDFRELF